MYVDSIGREVEDLEMDNMRRGHAEAEAEDAERELLEAARAEREEYEARAVEEARRRAEAFETALWQHVIDAPRGMALTRAMKFARGHAVATVTVRGETWQVTNESDPPLRYRVTFLGRPGNESYGYSRRGVAPGDVAATLLRLIGQRAAEGHDGADKDFDW